MPRTAKEQGQQAMAVFIWNDEYESNSGLYSP